MGIRPEHFFVHPPQEGKYHAVLEVEVQFIERLGHESFAFAQMGQHTLTARLSADEPVEPHCRMTLYADVNKMHFFDAQTGEVLD